MEDPKFLGVLKSSKVLIAQEKLQFLILLHI